MQTLDRLRKYGEPPFHIVAVHGGPGAPGSVAALAKELASFGTLEPFQSAHSIAGQIDELNVILDENGTAPFTLIGHSWGAMLVYLFAARYPSLVKKLILVSSGVFDAKFAPDISRTRHARMDVNEREQYAALLKGFNDPTVLDKNAVMARFGKMLTRVDAYDPLTLDTEAIDCQFDINQSVWQEAEAMRNSGKFLELGPSIQCPVTAIHGIYDPHPYQGVEEPLAQRVKNFKFVLLPQCGHIPWIERHARMEFYRILKQEL